MPSVRGQGLLPLLALAAGTGVLVLKRPASSPCSSAARGFAEVKGTFVCHTERGAAEQKKVALITGSSTGIGKAGGAVQQTQAKIPIRCRVGSDVLYC